MLNTHHILDHHPYMAMGNKPCSRFPALHGYGKQSIFNFPSQAMLWKTEHILVPQTYRAMENKTYTSSHTIWSYEKTDHILVPQPYKAMENKHIYSPQPYSATENKA
jgi:hypothetical protein